MQLSARQYVNLTRILRELLTNALKHAQPNSVWIALSGASDLLISFVHDGAVTDPQQWSWGRGQFNLATRAEEINGRLHFAATGEPGKQHLEVSLSVTL